MAEQPLSERVFLSVMETERTNRKERLDEQDRRHDEMKEQIDGVAKTVNSLIPKVVKVEQFEKSAKRVGWALVLGGIAVAWDAVANHLGLSRLLGRG